MEEKTADEIFEILGYIKHDNHPEDDYPPKPDTWVTQDCRQLYYEQKKVSEAGLEIIKHIEFDLISKTVICIMKIERNYILTRLNTQELLAISKKVEELGWNEKN